MRRNAACVFSKDPDVGEPISRICSRHSVVQDPFLPSPAPRLPPTFSSVLAQSKSAERMRSVLPIFVSTHLGIDRRAAPAPVELSARSLRDYNSPSSPHFCASPISRLPCNGWCVPEPNTNAPTVVSFLPCFMLLTRSQRSFMHIQVSLAACSDDQRTWEAYEGSLTGLVCSFLGKHTCFFLGRIYSVIQTSVSMYSGQNQRPSYQDLMTHIKHVLLSL